MHLTNTTIDSETEFTELDNALTKATAIQTKLKNDLEVAKILAQFLENPDEIKAGLKYLFSDGKYAEVCNVGLLLVENDCADVDIFCLLGQCFFARGYIDAAIKSYQSAKMLSPLESSIGINLAANYASIGEFGPAKEELMRVVDLDPENALAHLNLGIIYEAEHNEEEASKAFDSAVRLDESLISEINSARDRSKAPE